MSFGVLGRVLLLLVCAVCIGAAFGKAPLELLLWGPSVASQLAMDAVALGCTEQWVSSALGAAAESAIEPACELDPVFAPDSEFGALSERQRRGSVLVAMAWRIVASGELGPGVSAEAYSTLASHGLAGEDAGKLPPGIHATELPPRAPAALLVGVMKGGSTTLEKSLSVGPGGLREAHRAIDGVPLKESRLATHLCVCGAPGRCFESQEQMQPSGRGTSTGRPHVPYWDWSEGQPATAKITAFLRSATCAGCKPTHPPTQYNPKEWDWAMDKASEHAWKGEEEERGREGLVGGGLLSSSSTSSSSTSTPSSSTSSSSSSSSSSTSSSSSSSSSSSPSSSSSSSSPTSSSPSPFSSSSLAALRELVGFGEGFGEAEARDREDWSRVSSMLLLRGVGLHDVGHVQQATVWQHSEHSLWASRGVLVGALLHFTRTHPGDWLVPSAINRFPLVVHLLQKQATVVKSVRNDHAWTHVANVMKKPNIGPLSGKDGAELLRWTVQSYQAVEQASFLSALGYLGGPSSLPHFPSPAPPRGKQGVAVGCNASRLLTHISGTQRSDCAPHEWVPKTKALFPACASSPTPWACRRRKVLGRKRGDGNGGDAVDGTPEQLPMALAAQRARAYADPRTRILIAFRDALVRAESEYRHHATIQRYKCSTTPYSVMLLAELDCLQGSGGGNGPGGSTGLHPSFSSSSSSSSTSSSTSSGLFSSSSSSSSHPYPLFSRQPPQGACSVPPALALHAALRNRDMVGLVVAYQQAQQCCGVGFLLRGLMLPQAVAWRRWWPAKRFLYAQSESMFRNVGHTVKVARDFVKLPPTNKPIGKANPGGSKGCNTKLPPDTAARAKAFLDPFEDAWRTFLQEEKNRGATVML